MAVTLKNKTRYMHVFNLPHVGVCTEALCLCTRQKIGVQDHNPQTGEKVVRAVHARLGGSVTLCAAGTDGDTVGPLPNGVARLPEVAALIRKGAIAVSITPDIAPPAPPAETPTYLAELPADAALPAPELKTSKKSASAAKE